MTPPAFGQSDIVLSVARLVPVDRLVAPKTVIPSIEMVMQVTCIALAAESHDMGLDRRITTND